MKRSLSTNTNHFPVILLMATRNPKANHLGWWGAKNWVNNWEKLPISTGDSRISEASTV